MRSAIRIDASTPRVTNGTRGNNVSMEREDLGTMAHLANTCLTLTLALETSSSPQAWARRRSSRRRQARCRLEHSPRSGTLPI